MVATFSLIFVVFKVVVVISLEESSSDRLSLNLLKSDDLKIKKQHFFDNFTKCKLLRHVTKIKQLHYLHNTHKNYCEISNVTLNKLLLLFVAVDCISYSLFLQLMLFFLEFNS